MSIVTEKQIAPFLEPKIQDVVKMIGKDSLTRETSFALQAVNANNYLASATPQSVAKCVLNVAFTGLSLNPVLKYAYLTPRRTGSAIEAILMPSYIGLCKLITDTGAVRNIYAHLVHQEDEFDVLYGTSESIQHKPKFKGEVSHVYAVAVLPDGGTQFEVMTVDDVNEIRERSDSYKAFKAGKAKSCIWESDYGEMAKKTVIKRLTKYLPKTETWAKVSEAIEMDNQDFPATDGQYIYIESLLDNSTYDEKMKEGVMRRIVSGMTTSEAKDIIEHLRDNQLEPISTGGNYGQREISEKIKNEVV